MTDFQDAVQLWWDGEGKRKAFAVKIAFLPESDTSQLAESCRCSVDKIQLYRRAGALYYTMTQHFETPEVEQLWQDLTISHWIAAAKYKLTPEKTLEHLQHARDRGLSERSFRAHMDDVEHDLPKWMRTLNGMVRSAKSFMKNYMSELAPEKQELLREAVDEFAARLEEIAE